MSENKITAKCECGNKVSVYISDHLSTIARPVDDKKHAALMGMGKCEKCGKDVWVFSYIEIHEAQADVKEECKKCMRYTKSCKGTDYFREQEHYYCITEWESFKKGFLGTRFTETELRA